MAPRRIFPIHQRDPATVQLAKACEVHLRLMKQQEIHAREMSTIARDMVRRAIAMRTLTRIFLP